jgi:outer membrane biogenesis lipoprotein LolB
MRTIRLAALLSTLLLTGCALAAPTAPSPVGIITVSGDVNFGIVQVFTTAHRSFTISNRGTDVLSVTGMNVPLFYAADWTGGTIEAGSSHTVTLAFTPPTFNSFQGVLHIYSSAGETTIGVTGAGALPSCGPVNVGPCSGGGL